jgi:hypothetical protein
VFRPPPRLANGGSLQGLLGAAHPPRGTIFVVAWTLLAVANFRELREGEVRAAVEGRIAPPRSPLHVAGNPALAHPFFYVHTARYT